MMTKTMAECALRMLHEWRNEIKEEVEMSRQFQELTANIISHTVFGTSNSIHGKQIFLAQKELLSLVVADIGGSK